VEEGIEVRADGKVEERKPESQPVEKPFIEGKDRPSPSANVNISAGGMPRKM
jgi:hypothetical protein